MAKASPGRPGRHDVCAEAEIALRGAAAPETSAQDAASANGCPAASRSRSDAARRITRRSTRFRIDGILISGRSARSCRGPELRRDAAGDRRLPHRIGERSKAGAQAQFERPDAALIEKIEDKLWAIQDDNTEASPARWKPAAR
jgi:methyl-accepting chemotaxis protein